MGNEHLSGKGFYEDQVKKKGVVFEAQGMSKLTQVTQFEAVIQWIKGLLGRSSFTLLDVGGGIGDLLMAATDAGLVVQGYGCVDTNKDFLLVAKERAKHFKVAQEFTDSVDKVHGRYDIVTCLNVCSYWEGGQAEFEKFCLDMLGKCWSRAIVGCAINCPSPYADYKRETQRQMPVDVALRAARSLSSRVTVDFAASPHLYLMLMARGDSKFLQRWGEK